MARTKESCAACHALQSDLGREAQLLAAADKRLMAFSIRLRSILSAAIPAEKVRRQKARNVRVEIAESSSDDAESPFMTQRKAVSWAETALPETRLVLLC
jgi:hypothetical protein